MSINCARCLILGYSEVPNRRADQDKRAGLEKNYTLPAFLLIKLINEQGGIFFIIPLKIASRVERKSEKSKQACSSIRDLRVGSRKRSDGIVPSIYYVCVLSVFIGFIAMASLVTQPMLQLRTKKFGGNNPSILAPYNSVSVAT